jgi:PAS domain S-box-containing protein
LEVTSLATDKTLRSEPSDRAKILLVDDSLENLVSLEASLQGLGQDLILAQSGADALRHLLESDFAAILLDVKMPVMDGFQTAEMIRARKRSRHTPIIFLTGYQSDDHLFRGYDLGAVDFLFKPIVPEILRSKVSVFVQLSQNTELLRRQTEVLGKAEQKFRFLLEAAPDAMVISSEDGRISLVNSRAEVLFGFPRSELIGQNICMLVPGWRNSSQSPGVNSELQAVRKDGGSFSAEISLSPLQTEEGLLLTSAVRDVTERRKAHEQIRELNAKLEQRVAERTAELMASNEALRKSNDDLNQFAYAASHDLQEPLRLVSLYSQMLQRKYTGSLDDQAHQYINFLINGTQRMELLLKNLLAYSQVGTPGEGPAGPVACSDVLRQVLLNLKASIDLNGAVVTWNDLPTVHAHEVRLVQLFQNLIGNAIKYRRTEPPRVHVAAEYDESAWRFSVRDNGIGIKSQYAQQIFGLFKRLHGGANPGSGIGLAICQRIVESYGGRIGVESVPDEGSVFFFILPEESGKTVDL